MIGRDIKCKSKYSYQGYSLDKAFECIQLKEPKEVGQIINEYWLIINCDFEDNITFKYDAGNFAKVIDIRCLDVFETDFNYDDRNDLIKLGVSKVQYFNNIIDVNIYGYKY